MKMENLTVLAKCQFHSFSVTTVVVSEVTDIFMFPNMSKSILMKFKQNATVSYKAPLRAFPRPLGIYNKKLRFPIKASYSHCHSDTLIQKRNEL